MRSRILQHGELQSLVDVGSVGMTCAAAALSQLIGKEVRFEVPRLLLLGSPDGEAIFNDRRMFGLSLQISGDARGGILILFPCDCARNLLRELLGGESAPELDAMELSALKEIGNILASAYLNAVGGRFRMALLPSPPTFGEATGRELLEQALRLSGAAAAAVAIETVFSVADIAGSGCLVLLPDPGSLDAFLPPETR